MLRTACWISFPVFVFSLLALAHSAESQAPGGTIGVYSDSLGTSDEITVPPYTTTRFYILAHPDLAATGGLKVATFRVKYFPPPELVLVALGNPEANAASTTPFTDESLPSPRGGAVVAWEVGNCAASGTTGMVLLYSVDAYALGLVADVVLEVDRYDDLGPSWPYMFACNDVEPPNDPVEMDGLSATINGGTVSVESRPWAALKQLFR